MRRALLVICAAGLAGACVFDPSGLAGGADAALPSSPDAAEEPRVDAATGAPDAASPDATAGAPDAASPDAAAGAPDAASPDAAASAPDAASPDPDCDITPLLAGGTFVPELVAGVNSTAEERDPFLTADGKTLYFMSTRAGGQGGQDIWRATRDSRDDPFSTPVNVTELNTSFEETRVSLTEDQLVLALTSSRNGNFDVFLSQRDSTGDPFSTPVPVDMANTTGDDHDPAISLDGQRLYFSSTVPGGAGDRDIVLSTRPAPPAPFQSAQSLANVNTSGLEADPAFTPDELVLMFTRAGDIHFATRASTQDDFSTPAPLTAINTGSPDDDPFISRDRCELFFVSDRPGGVGGRDIYRVRLDR